MRRKSEQREQVKFKWFIKFRLWEAGVCVSMRGIQPFLAMSSQIFHQGTLFQRSKCMSFPEVCLLLQLSFIFSLVILNSSKKLCKTLIHHFMQNNTFPLNFCPNLIFNIIFPHIYLLVLLITAECSWSAQIIRIIGRSKNQKRIERVQEGI